MLTSMTLLFSCNRDGTTHAGKLDDMTAEVLVYGATPSGIMTAYAVKKLGRSVVIVEPGRWVGGILGAGLKPMQDMPNYEAVGGKTRELMLTLGIDSAAGDLSYDEVWQITLKSMSPKDVRESFLKFLADNDIPVVYEHRINRVVKEGTEITEGVFDLAPFDQYGCPPEGAEVYENFRVKAKVFVDASYEGELMARSGVSFRVGRESTMDYNEKLAGVRPIGDLEEAKRTAVGKPDLHGLGNITPISPFVEPGNPESGLLPMVDKDHGKALGAGDQYTQAYNYRFYVTSDPERRAPITAPENYDPADFELVGRYVEYLKETIIDEQQLSKRLSGIFPGWLNAGEYNYQRHSLITMAPLGISHLYANGDYATKARIWKEHQNYLRGLHHFLSTDQRVPESFRVKTASLGLDKYHHPDTEGWPHQLYIRVGRRLIGEYTVTERDVYSKLPVKDPIGLAQYGIDTYPARRILMNDNKSTYVAIEGNMFVGGAKGPKNTPYPISYRAITPLKQECTNLLVPVAFSSTHVGYASARMEPTFMIVGESAGVAAAHAIEQGVPVQDIDGKLYLTKLNELGQRLVWNKTP